MKVKRTKLEVMVTRDQMDRLEKAAAMRGQDLTSFALVSLLNQADRIICGDRSQGDAIVLSHRDFKRMMSATEALGEPSPSLKAAWKRYREGRG